MAVGTAFLVLGAIVWWRGHDTATVVVAAIGATLVAAGLLIPRHLGPVYRGWMGLALAISRVTTPILMGLVYFIAVAPIGLVRRLLGHSIGPSSSASTFWVPRDEAAGTVSDLTRQF